MIPIIQKWSQGLHITGTQGIQIYCNIFYAVLVEISIFYANKKCEKLTASKQIQIKNQNIIVLHLKWCEMQIRPRFYSRDCMCDCSDDFGLKCLGALGLNDWNTEWRSPNSDKNKGERSNKNGNASFSTFEWHATNVLIILKSACESLTCLHWKINQEWLVCLLLKKAGILEQQTGNIYIKSTASVIGFCNSAIVKEEILHSLI